MQGAAKLCLRSNVDCETAVGHLLRVVQQDVKHAIARGHGVGVGGREEYVYAFQYYHRKV